MDGTKKKFGDTPKSLRNETFFAPNWYWPNLRRTPAPKTSTSRITWIRYCLLGSEEHRYLNQVPAALGVPKRPHIQVLYWPTVD